MRPYRSPRPRDGPRRRSSLGLARGLLVVAALVAALGCGALVLAPDLASRLPDPIGARLHALALGARSRLAALLSDAGPLGGVRRFAEPLLSKLGLNLETALLGLALLLVAVVCIRVLAVTSRQDEEGEGDVFLERAEADRGEGTARSPYWPYTRRPGRLGAPPPSAPAARPGVPGGWPTAGQTGPGPGLGDRGVATGDAWPVVRGRTAGEPGPYPAYGTGAPPPGGELGGGEGVGPEAGGPAPAAGVAAGDVLPTGQPASEPLAPPSALFAPAPPVSPAPAEVAPQRGLLGREPSVGESEAAAAAQVASAGPGALSALIGTSRAPGVAPPVPVGSAHTGEEYLEDVPPSPASWGAPEAVGPPYAGPVGVFGPTREPLRPEPGPAAAETWVEVRPRLGTGLKKFSLPGFMLLLLGAGSAYGLEMPFAAIFTSGPFSTAILGGALGIASASVALWFYGGPMRPVARRVRESAEPQEAAWSPRPVAPAPVPAREALEGGLEAPDASDWGAIPRPSVFIPWSQRATSVGVDLGTAWIKVVQVAISRSGPEIVNVGLCPTPEGLIGENGVTDPATLGATLKELFAERHISQRRVLAALGGPGVIIRHVQFPRMTEEELREVIRWEAEHHIPIPQAEAVVDFTIMPSEAEADERGTEQMRIMLVGAQRKVVEAQVEAFRKAKLDTRGIDIEALASYRVVQAAGHRVEDPLRYAESVVDLGHSSTKLGIYLRGALEMSRTLGVGGRTFTGVLAQQLKVSEVEAETLKRQYGVRPEGGRVLQAVSSTLQDLFFEIRRSFEFFSSRHFGQSVRRIYLVGGGARTPGFAEALGRYLNPALGERVPEGAGTQPMAIDPLSAALLTPRLESQANLIGPEFVNALGLALAEGELYEG